jgi:hypothetical protein
MMGGAAVEGKERRGTDSGVHALRYKVHIDPYPVSQLSVFVDDFLPPDPADLVRTNPSHIDWSMERRKKRGDERATCFLFYFFSFSNNQLAILPSTGRDGLGERRRTCMPGPLTPDGMKQEMSALCRIFPLDRPRRREYCCTARSTQTCVADFVETTNADNLTEIAQSR